MIDFTNPQHTAIMELFDWWADIPAIAHTMRARGLEVCEEELADEANRLHEARLRYPGRPLHEAYRSYIEIAPRGVGDTVAKFFHAAGVHKLAEAYTRITGKECGCAGRQSALNRMFPYGDAK